MRLMLISSGVEWSTADVHDGLRWGLKQGGHEIIDFNLEERAKRWKVFLKYLYKKAKRESPGKVLAHPTYADIVYKASCDVLERALRFEPDWVVITSGMFFHPDAIVFLRRAGFKVACVFTESPYDDESQLRVAELCDVSFVNEKSSVEAFQAVSRAFYLGAAYHPERHNPQAPVTSVKGHDVVFVGTPWEDRVAMLRAVDWDGIDLGLYGTWGVLDSDDPLAQYVQGGITTPAETSSLYRTAKIGLNWHRTQKGSGLTSKGTIEYAASMNPRCYELAACGAFFVSDSRDELVEIFGDTVPTFSSAGELRALIARWAPDANGRKQLATEALARIAPHHWGNRAKQVVEALQIA